MRPYFFRRFEDFLGRRAVSRPGYTVESVLSVPTTVMISGKLRRKSKKRAYPKRRTLNSVSQCFIARYRESRDRLRFEF